MCGSNLLFILTGSIACYKACAALSLLVQAGHQVRVAATESALRFGGTATLEGLTGRPVLNDLWAAGNAMEHIHLTRWADVTVMCPVSAPTLNRLGRAILPGVGVSAETLASRTAELPRVEITRPEAALGHSTVESIQSGLFHGNVGAIRYLISLVAIEAFDARKTLVIGTGGFARMFVDEGLFDEVVPESVLNGLRYAHALNQDTGK